MTKEDNLTWMQRDRLQRGMDPNSTATSMSMGNSASPGIKVTESIQEHPSAINEPQKPDDSMAFHDRRTPERTATLTYANTVKGTNAADTKPRVWKTGGNKSTDQ